MDFGLALVGRPARELIQLARHAEERGFSTVYVPDHFANEPPGTGQLDETIVQEAIAMLAGIAASTRRVRLGGHVLCNLLRHPALTAQVVGTIDQISAGRAILGIGAGWTRNEFEMTGLPFPDIKPRLRMLDEAIRVIKSLWTQKRTTFDGEFYRLKDAFITAQPDADPHPPILMGGSGKGLLRIAAREADVVNIIIDTGKAGTVLPSELTKLTDEGFRAKVDFVRTEAAKHGRTLTISTTVFVPYLSDDEETAARMAEGIAAGFGLDGEQARRMPLALIGTPDQCIDELKRREREWGVEHVVLSGGAGPELVERFGREILPHV